MAAREDSCTAQHLDSSVPGGSDIGEASDSSQGDTSSHETEVGAEKTAEVDAAAVLSEELLDDHLRSSAASENAFAESRTTDKESPHSAALPQPDESAPLASNKPAEPRPPLLPRLSASLSVRAQSRSSSTTPDQASVPDSDVTSASSSAAASSSISPRHASANSQPLTLEKLYQLMNVGTSEATGEADVSKLHGHHSRQNADGSRSQQPPSMEHLAEPSSKTTTTAINTTAHTPAMAHSLPPEHAPTYFRLPFEASTGGWDSTTSMSTSATEPVSRFPLEHRWTFYQQTPHDSNKKVGTLSRNRPAYESSLTELGEATSVESFARLFTPLKTPSTQELGTSIYIFKAGIIPAWEHEANANGGKWSLLIKGDVHLLDRSWLWLVLALVGEKLAEAEEVCGAVLSIRPRDNRIQLWCRDKSRVSHLNGLGRHLLNVLELSSLTKGLHLEFFPHNSGSSSPSSPCFSINNAARPAKAAEVRRGSFDGAPSGLAALSEGSEGARRITKPSPLGTTMVSGSGWRKPSTEVGEANERAPSGGESDGWNAEVSRSRPTASTSRSAWW